jgi:hypothetical protein
MRTEADGESPEGSWIVREEWILGGTAAVCILSILRLQSSPQGMIESGKPIAHQKDAVSGDCGS